ncbi:MAG: NUDIX domain-containing protein [Archangium sp.]|nr:NUDIX domain-containing protein [Archangium sp.]
MSDRPLVGVGVLVMKHGKLLLGKRLNAHGAGEYASPGGHLEQLESFEACARREVREETGLELGDIRFLRLLNTTQYAPRHYVDVSLVAEWRSGEPQVLEPHKVERWEWFDLDALPTPLFGMLHTSVEALRTGRTFWDAAPMPPR